MRTTKTKMNHARYPLLMIAFVLVSLMAPKADAWGDSIPAAIIKQAMETIYDTIQGTMLGALKTSALALLNTQTMSLIGGVSGKSPIISDWKNFIYDEANTQTVAYKEGLLTSIFEGRNTSMYSGTSGSDYYSILADSIKGSTGNALRINAAELIGGDPALALQNGDLRALTAVTSNPVNNPYGLSLTVDSLVAEKQSQVIEEQVLKVTSTGVAPVEKDGKTVLPAKSVSDAMSTAQGSLNQILSGTSKPEEILGVIAASAANQFMKKMMEKVTTEVQTKVTVLDRRITNQVNSIMSPIEKVSAVVRQQTGLEINPLANPGKAAPNPNACTLGGGC